MSRQYNMYNVQLSEFWKQRVSKEAQHNAPYLSGLESEDYDVASEAPSRAPSMISATSTVTQQKARTAPRAALRRATPRVPCASRFLPRAGMHARASSDRARWRRADRRADEEMRR